MILRLSRLLPLISAGALVLASLPVQAAGFDCAKATSITEKAICANGELLKLDGALTVAWKSAMEAAADPTAVKASQLRWLKLRDACRPDASCLAARYNERLAALADSHSATTTDQAGNRLEALMAENAGRPTDADEKRCTADKQVCIQVVRQGGDSAPEIEVERTGDNASTYRFARSEEEDTSQASDVTLWPHLLRLANNTGAIVIGVEVNTHAGYSGGGGSASELRLFEIARDKSTFREREVLSVPVAGSLMIRACFSEEDQRRRLDACHDEYEFGATLRLDEGVKSGLPRLVYQTLATSFPGKVSRFKDSLAGPPLRERDLVTVANARCSYKRIFRFEADKNVFTPDHPLPDCSEFTVP